MKATDNQVDGTHYNKLKIQPLMLAYQLNASPCFCKLAKYISRDKDNKLVQLEKAKHVIELERELINEDSLYGSIELHYDLINIEHVEKIKAFAVQFDTPNCIMHCLNAMFVGDYDTAQLELKFLTARYTNV